MNRSRALLLAVAVVAPCAVAASEAGAAYSGTITRAFCATSGLFPDGNVGAGWVVDSVFSGACGITWKDASSQGEIYYNTPVERRTSNVGISTKVRATGSSNAASGRVCATSRTYSASGALFMKTLPICTGGASPIGQDLVAGLIVLPALGAANTVVTATDTGKVHLVSWTYQSNGN